MTVCIWILLMLMNILKINNRLKFITKLFTLFLGTFLLLSCSQSESSKTYTEIDTSIQIATDYMVRATDAQGLFLYTINMNQEVRVKLSYNMLRHAGAIYAMCTAYENNPNVELRNAILRTGSFLQDSTIYALPDEPTIMAVWSDSKIVGGKNPISAKLGGTGLGLIALTSIERIQPGFTPVPMLEGLGDFIVYSQKSDGSYYSKYIPSEGGRMDNWTSLYYPGEAALGLMMLYEIDKNDKWIKPAAKTLEYLAKSREGYASVPADHWAMMATEKLMELPQEKLPISKDILLAHGVQICKSIFTTQIQDSSRAKFYGGFNSDGRVTPTSTRLEGLIAARSFIPYDHYISDRLDKAINLGITFLLNAQIKDGFYSGGFPRAVKLKKEYLPKAKNFNKLATEIRIDYVQHALSAMIKYKNSN